MHSCPGGSTSEVCFLDAAHCARANRVATGKEDFRCFLRWCSLRDLLEEVITYYLHSCGVLLLGQGGSHGSCAFHAGSHSLRAKIPIDRAALHAANFLLSIAQLLMVWRVARSAGQYCLGKGAPIVHLRASSPKICVLTLPAPTSCGPLSKPLLR